MFSRKYKKQSKLKRLILKLLNVYAYNKETLNIENPNYKNQSGNLIKLNDKSFNYARGYLDLTRKIKNLDIYYRYAPKVNLWNSTDRWKRIVPDINKETLISVSLLSLKNSILNFLKNNKVKITLHLISDNSSNDFDSSILKLLNDDKIIVKRHVSKINGNRGSYLECCDQAEKAEDLIFFIEDDYLFEQDCIEELLLTFSRISSLLNEDIAMCPTDYPFYYDSLYKTSLLVGNKYKWRIVGETLLTFMISKNLFNKYKKKIRLVGEKVNEPFEKPLHEVYKEVKCIAPVNTLSYHISRTVPATTEDWLKTWNENYTTYKRYKLTSYHG